MPNFWSAGGSAPRLPKQPPHCEFLATRLSGMLGKTRIDCEKLEVKSFTATCRKRGQMGKGVVLRQL